MQLVEQHRIDRHDPRWKTIDAATFASKHLYNAAMYVKRQAYIHENHRMIAYTELDKLMQLTGEYRALPAKVAQQVLRHVCAAWDSDFAAVSEWQKHPGKFLGHPKLPKYLDKMGRNLLDRHLIASIDIGVNNLAAITSNQPGFVPLLVNGRPLKSLNQGYNKRRAKLQAQLPAGQFTSRALDELTDHRTRCIQSYLHTASRAIIEQLVRADIRILVIGKNDG